MPFKVIREIYGPLRQRDKSTNKNSGKFTSTTLQAHALFDADAARSYPAFSLEGLSASRFCGQCRKFER
jgi:hypothetical protein